MNSIRQLVLPYLAMILIVAPLIGVGWFAMIHFVPGTYQLYESIPPQPAGLLFSIRIWDLVYHTPYALLILIVAFVLFEKLYKFKNKPTVRTGIVFAVTLANVLLIANVLLFLFSAGSSKMIMSRIEKHTEEREQGEQSAAPLPPAPQAGPSEGAR